MSVWLSYRGDLARLRDLSPRLLRDLAGLEILLYGTGLEDTDTSAAQRPRSLGRWLITSP